MNNNVRLCNVHSVLFPQNDRQRTRTSDTDNPTRRRQNVTPDRDKDYIQRNAQPVVSISTQTYNQKNPVFTKVMRGEKYTEMWGRNLIVKDSGGENEDCHSCKTGNLYIHKVLIHEFCQHTGTGRDDVKVCPRQCALTLGLTTPGLPKQRKTWKKSAVLFFRSSHFPSPVPSWLISI